MSDKKTLNIRCDVTIGRCEDGHFVPKVALVAEGLPLKDFELIGSCFNSAESAKESGLKKAMELIEISKAELSKIKGIEVRVLDTTDFAVASELTIH